MAINFGIIGHGFMGHEHEKVLSDFKGIRLVGISDRAAERLFDVKPGIKRYASNEDLLADPEIQVVLIAINNNQHHQVVIQSAEAGKDIICEKPVAMNVEELDDMVRVCKANGVKFTVHHQRRYDPDFRSLKMAYDSGSLGDIYMIKSSLYGYNGNVHEWHAYKSEGGGMLYDWGVHLLDQMLWMIDSKIKTVFADVRNVVNTEVDDYFKILLCFENGIVGEVELGTYFLSDKAGWFDRHWLIGGSQGSAYIDGFAPNGMACRTSRLLYAVSEKGNYPAAGPTRSFGPVPEGLLLTEPLEVAQTLRSDFFTNYVAAYQGKEEFMVKIPETRRVLKLMAAVRQSADIRQSVAFE